MPAPTASIPGTRSSAVVSDQADAFGAASAPFEPACPSVHVGRHDGEARADYDARLADVVAGFAPDFIVLAGWMRILTTSFLGWFPERVDQPAPGAARRAPRHAGDRARPGRKRSPANVRVTGVMVHLVPDEGVDDGPVLASPTFPSAPTTPSRRSNNASTTPSTACSSTPFATAADRASDNASRMTPPRRVHR